MTKICKNCVRWEKNNDPDVNEGINTGNCKLEPFDIRSMKQDDCAIGCGHDGSIAFGQDYGCIHWE